MFQQPHSPSTRRHLLNSITYNVTLHSLQILKDNLYVAPAIRAPIDAQENAKFLLHVIRELNANSNGNHRPIIRDIITQLKQDLDIRIATRTAIANIPILKELVLLHNCISRVVSGTASYMGIQEPLEGPMFSMILLKLLSVRQQCYLPDPSTAATAPTTPRSSS